MSTGRDRSLGGCSTCRSRHIKCDEQRPFCKTCLTSGVPCLGYEIRLRFVQDGQHQALSADDASKFRRPLFTESQRRDMSRDLVAVTGKRDPGRLIAELDDLTAFITTSQRPPAIFRGPFGVFRPEDESPSPTSSSTTGSQEVCSINAFLTAREVRDVSVSNLAEPFESTDELDFNFDDVENLDIAYSPTMFNSILLEGGPQLSFDNTIDLSSVMDATQMLVPLQFPPSSIPQSLPLVPPAENLVPRDGWFLLQHYRDNVIKLLSPLKQHLKTPWHILHFPTATNTLAELNMNSVVNPARLAILQAILSLSSYNLRGTSTNATREYWSAAANNHRQRAQFYLKQCLSQENGQGTAKKAKYKEILMAILCMVTISVFSGAGTAVNAYLLDAEQWIRLRGLTKPKLSKKTRLLHHNYAYIRILHETTTHLNDASTLATSFSPMTTSSGIRSTDRFRISEWTPVPDFCMVTDKDPKLAERDLHLEFPGRWEMTMYPDIYGIPESLMMFISHVTRLGNERDAFTSSTGGPGPAFRDFSIRAKILETCICDWKPPATEQSSRTRNEGSMDQNAIASNQRIINLMNLAIHKALLIYFYRRVYDVNAKTLQHEVEMVKHYLSEWQLEDARQNEYTVGIVWPAFVASCEALSFELQEFFSSWFRESYQKNSIDAFETARVVAENIWTRRKALGDDNISWPEILRAQKFTVVYT